MIKSLFYRTNLYSAEQVALSLSYSAKLMDAAKEVHRSHRAARALVLSKAKEKVNKN